MSYRPQQWAAQAPQKVILTFPGQGTAPQYNSTSGPSVTLPATQTLYAFDAEIGIEHQQQIERTKHPVQTGASISDHAYIVPARLVMDVIMSDAVDAYFTPSTWSGSSSKSISAYMTMLALSFARIPLTITTRLRTYSNMIIEALTPQESNKTYAGLRMRIEFGQIFVADVTQVPVSARPQDSNTTNLGNINPQPPTAAQVSQNNIMDAPSADMVLQYNAIGGGDWSSNSLSNQVFLPAPK